MIKYSMSSKCLDVKYMVNHTQIEAKNKEANDEKEGELSKILDGDGTSLLEKKSSKPAVYSDAYNNKGEPFYMLKEHLITGKQNRGVKSMLTTRISKESQNLISNAR